MFPAETVVLTPRVRAGTDGHRDPEWAAGEPVEVPGCLVAPGDPSAETLEDVPEGCLVAATVYVPEASCALPWRGGSVAVRGRPYRVVGDPAPWAGSPTAWSMAVRLERRE